MNFAFSDSQEAVREQARRFLTKACPTSAVRRVLEGEASHDAALWRGMAELGWTATAIPEAYGGLGLGDLELCVLAEELGRALAPVPFASSVYLATEALLLAGSEAQKLRWLPLLASGEAIGTLAMAEGVGPITAQRLRTRLEKGHLDGTKRPVADGGPAHFAIVVAHDVEANGPSLALVDLAGEGVSRQTVETIDPTRDQGALVFTRARAERLGEPGQGWSLTRDLLNRAAVLMAFEQTGGAQAALDMACDYARQRYAFARPIGSFQAIKHKLADIFVDLELARSNAYCAAWALDTHAPELGVAAAAARVAATQAYEFAATENIEIHGGNGYTWAFDCHLHYRRAKHLALALGAAPAWKERLIQGLETAHAAAP